MSDIAISVEHLGKQYRIGKRERYRALRDVITDGVAAPFRRLALLGRHGSNGHANDADVPDTFWALKDVSFEVKRGEVLGVIGRNGAGKSTLLKILSRITEPTEGRVRVFGRVGSLLEVGTGFHPELSGRENIFLNGAILGMKRADIIRQFDEIVAFAEVDKFIDTPVKHYSSGMYVRLAFAVAAHMEPEILIVDEVLSVGDATFQNKCLGKMGAIAQEGRTVLLVSHNMPSMESLCTRGLLLENGRIVAMGETAAIISKYMQEIDAQLKVGPRNSPGRYIRHVGLMATGGHRRTAFAIYEDIIFEVELFSEIFVDYPRFGIFIKSPRGERLAVLHTDIQQKTRWSFKGKMCIRALWKRVPLNVGEYHIDVSFWGYDHELESLQDYAVLRIYSRDVFGTGALPDPTYQGAVVADGTWQMDVNGLADMNESSGGTRVTN